MPSGDICPCTPPGGVDLGAWNASHSSRWNHVRTSLRREYPGLEFFRGVEVQQRGALHDHALVWSETPIDKGFLRQLAMRAGFGHSVDLAPITRPAQVAYYVSKYVIKAVDSRDAVPWTQYDVVMSTGEVIEREVPGRYRTWSMSRQWGVRMADVRAEARALVCELEARIDRAALDLLSSELGAVLVETLPSPP